MNILVFGKDGQLGKAFQHLLESIAADLDDPQNIQYIGRAQCDLANENDLNILLASSNPNLIINAAAYTAVDKAENEMDLAFAINAKAPEVMASHMQSRLRLLRIALGMIVAMRLTQARLSVN